MIHNQYLESIHLEYNFCGFTFPITFIPVPALPFTGGEIIWENEVCTVKKSGNVEIRIFRGDVDQSPYAISFINTDGERTVIVLASWWEKYQDTVYKYNPAALEVHLLDREALLLHSCFVCCEDKAVLFTGHSGIGKSTQGALWEKVLGAEVINGDRSAVSSQNGIWTASGIPFSGTSGICKYREAPIAAIVYLRQGKQESLQRIDGIDAAKLLYEQCTVNEWNAEFVSHVWELLGALVSSVPVYIFSCTMHDSAATFLYGQLFVT